MKFITIISLSSICVLFFLLPTNIYGQTKPEDLTTKEFVAPKTVATQVEQPRGEEGLGGQIVRLKKELLDQESKHTFYAVMALCALSLITLLLTLLSLRRSQYNASARDVVNAMGLIIIVFGTIILVLVSPTHEQMTAAVGILGAIAGYLFGTMQVGRSIKAD